VDILTCSKSFPENLKGRIYPDEIVLLGIGIFLDKHGERPKSIYLQNHGFVALGSTSTEVENITLMANKAAEIRFGAILVGGINTLPKNIVIYISERADEKYRQRLFEKSR